MPFSAAGALRIIALCTLALVLSAQPAASSLHLRLLPQASPTVFTLELRNRGSSALVLNVGIMFANGQQQYPDKIRLQMRDPANRLIPLKNMHPTVVGGRMDPMVVPLPAGAAFSLTLDLAQHAALSKGRYTLQPEYTGVAVSQQSASRDMKGVSLMPFWIGKITSNVVRFTVK